jgi:hypothetical protein
MDQGQATPKDGPRILTETYSIKMDPKWRGGFLLLCLRRGTQRPPRASRFHSVPSSRLESLRRRSRSGAPAPPSSAKSSSGGQDRPAGRAPLSRESLAAHFLRA